METNKNVKRTYNFIRSLLNYYNRWALSR